MDTKNTFHIISLKGKMIWLFDLISNVISNHFSTGHTPKPRPHVVLPLIVNTVPIHLMHLHAKVDIYTQVQ